LAVSVGGGGVTVGIAGTGVPVGDNIGDGISVVVGAGCSVGGAGVDVLHPTNSSTITKRNRSGFIGRVLSFPPSLSRQGLQKRNKTMTFVPLQSQTILFIMTAQKTKSLIGNHHD
jgi:hypothetical protein